MKRKGLWLSEKRSNHISEVTILCNIANWSKKENKLEKLNNGTKNDIRSNYRHTLNHNNWYFIQLKWEKRNIVNWSKKV